MMVRFSPAGAFCASAPVARNPVTAQSAHAANPRRVNIRSSLVVHAEIRPDGRPLSSPDGAVRAALSRYVTGTNIPGPLSSRVIIGNDIGAFGDHRDAGVLGAGDAASDRLIEIGDHFDAGQRTLLGRQARRIKRDSTDAHRFELHFGLPFVD